MPIGSTIGIVRASKDEELEDILVEWGLGVGALYALIYGIIVPFVLSATQVVSAEWFLRLLGMQSISFGFNWLIVIIVVFFFGIAETLFGGLIYRFLEWFKDFF